MLLGMTHVYARLAEQPKYLEGERVVSWQLAEVNLGSSAACKAEQQAQDGRLGSRHHGAWC